MNYEGVVYRPPSEAKSLIVQVTIGCSHNQCSFCSMYRDKKFRIKETASIIKALKAYRKMYPSVKRIFLADGDAFILKMDAWLEILKAIKTIFPECQKVSAYATPKDVLAKSVEDLKLLKAQGLTMLYMGIESGSDAILSDINKGVTSKEIIEAGQRVVQGGIKLSVTLISGLGGQEKWQEHALASSKVISEINPDFVGLLTLMVEDDTPMYDKIQACEMKLLSPKEVLEETYVFIKNLKVSNCLFRSNHASNYVSLAGTLNQDQGQILEEIKSYLEDEFDFKDEQYRSL